MNHRGEEGWHWPSYSVVRKKARRDIPAGLRTLANKGSRAFNAKHVPKGRRDYESIASGDEYVGDERKLDIGCRVQDGDGQWHVSREIFYTAWEDVRSRMIVGSIVSTYANSSTILGSLKKAIAEHGKPRMLRTDWGKDYRKAAGGFRRKQGNIADFDGECIGTVLDRLGIEVHPTAEPYSPHAKPIESFFRQLKDEHDRLYPSFCGGSPADRHESRDRWVRENIDKLPTLPDVAKTIAQYEHIYNNTVHGSLSGLSSAQAMEQFRSEPARKESDRVLDFVFLEFIGPKLVRRDGVRFQGHWFGHGHADLIARQGQKVYLALQPDDLGTAWVCDLDRTPRFRVECDGLRYVSKREAERWAKMRARLKRDYNARAREARKVLLTYSPMQLLERRAAGLESMHGVRVPLVAQAPVFTARPALEAALGQADRRSLAAASNRPSSEDRTSLELLDLLDYEPAPVGPRARPGFAEDVEEPSAITHEDFLGEN